MSPKAWSILILLQSVVLAAWFFFVSGFVGILEESLYQGLLEGKPLPLITTWICSIHHPESELRLIAVCLFLATSHWLVGTLLVCSPRCPDAALPRWLFFSTCSWGVLLVYFAFLLCVLLLPFITTLQKLTIMTPEMIASDERKKLADCVYFVSAAIYALASIAVVYFRLKARRTTQSREQSSADASDES